MIVTKVKKNLIWLMAVVLLISFTSCGGTSEDGSGGGGSVDYEENLDAYAGVWYSGDDSGQAYFLLGHGMYTKYLIAMGEDPEKIESGLFKKIAGEDILSFGNPVDQTYSENYRMDLSGDSISDGDITFNRITTEEDDSILYTLMEMEVPMETYLGEWENDSIFAHLVIENDGYNYYDEDLIRAGGIEKKTDHLILSTVTGPLKLEVTEDGGLQLEGISGTFYPKAD